MKIKRTPASYTRSMWDGPSYEEGETGGREVYVTEREIFSCVLGPDGWPLEYEDEPFGFDLRRRDA